MAIDYDDLADAIVKGDKETAWTLAGKGLADGKAEGRDDLVMAKEILNKGLIAGMKIRNPARILVFLHNLAGWQILLVQT